MLYFMIYLLLNFLKKNRSKNSTINKITAFSKEKIEKIKKFLFFY